MLYVINKGESGVLCGHVKHGHIARGQVSGHAPPRKF